MKVNVTAGDCLNRILQARYPKEEFLPFREAMIEGPCSSKPFSPEYLEERAAFHHQNIEQYRQHMAPFLFLLDHLDQYEEIILWFGEEPFCAKNVEVIVDTLREHGYKKALTLHTVNEENGDILATKSMQKSC